ncbi:FeoA family protein [Qipengyuania sphaerica]|uniref:FeoA family protein n=1 Tax=Qipengyuania sphaerica TaxID=2867243 RepID=UPI001C86D7F1|nr:FeoA family protein [Qipengyuania sphaerica]MBX7541263.1 ferrous iron transport protein A [Qipengyuania sphaerica]
MTLDGFDSGKSARITGVDWDALAQDEGKRLKALGVDEGAEVAILHRGVFGGRDPIAMRLGNMTIAIRRMHARAIHVEAA